MNTQSTPGIDSPSQAENPNPEQGEVGDNEDDEDHVRVSSSPGVSF